MPRVTASDQVGLHLSTLNKNGIAAFPTGSSRYAFPLDDLLSQIVSDRLSLAGDHLGAGDQLIRSSLFRSSISRHYYAMYHAARAVVFAAERGDDYERHNLLPRHLPKQMNEVASMEADLTNARFLRNQADYDCYPMSLQSWEDDARALAAAAAKFLNSCENFALTNGYI